MVPRNDDTWYMLASNDHDIYNIGLEMLTAFDIVCVGVRVRGEQHGQTSGVRVRGCD